MSFLITAAVVLALAVLVAVVYLLLKQWVHGEAIKQLDYLTAKHLERMDVDIAEGKIVASRMDKQIQNHETVFKLHEDRAKEIEDSLEELSDKLADLT